MPSSACDWSSDVCSSDRSEEHTSELQSRSDLVCRLLLEKKKTSIIAPQPKALPQARHLFPCLQPPSSPSPRPLSPRNGRRRRSAGAAPLRYGCPQSSTVA